MVVYKLKDGVSLGDDVPVQNYQIPLDAATVAAGVTIRTADRLNTTDRGTQIAIAVTYDDIAEDTTIDVTAIAAIGLTFDVLRGGVSQGSITIGSNGTGQLVDAGALVAGNYVFKAICTTAGAAFGSFAEVTITV